MKNTFSIRLKELRLENQLTENEFAKLIGVSSKQISNWENQKNKPNANHLFRICKQFNVRANYMLGIDNIKHPK